MIKSFKLHFTKPLVGDDEVLIKEDFMFLCIHQQSFIGISPNHNRCVVMFVRKTFEQLGIKFIDGECDESLFMEFTIPKFTLKMMFDEGAVVKIEYDDSDTKHPIRSIRILDNGVRHFTLVCPIRRYDDDCCDYIDSFNKVQGHITKIMESDAHIEIPKCESLMNIISEACLIEIHQSDDSMSFKIDTYNYGDYDIEMKSFYRNCKTINDLSISFSLDGMAFLRPLMRYHFDTMYFTNSESSCLLCANGNGIFVIMSPIKH